MEEIRQTAKACYETVPKNVKNLAKEFFNTMDDNGDNTVSFHEFAAFMSQEGYECMNNRTFFEEINRDKSGSLSFEDVMTLYYIIKSGRPLCGGCRKLIRGLYFTCLKCFDCESMSFCLHLECFSGMNYTHNHAKFLDNYALLEFMRQKGLPQEKKNKLSSGSSSSTSLAIVQTSKTSKRKAAFKKMEMAIGMAASMGNIASVGNIATSGCTIM